MLRTTYSNSLCGGGCNVSAKGIVLNLRGKFSITTALIAGLLIIPATPSLAAGSWTSSITNTLTGLSSGIWSVHDADSAATRTIFSTCTEIWGSPKQIKRITVALVDHHGPWLPVATVATKSTSGCDSVSMGDRKKGTYNLAFKKISGPGSTVGLTAKKVTPAH